MNYDFKAFEELIVWPSFNAIVIATGLVLTTSDITTLMNPHLIGPILLASYARAIGGVLTSRGRQLQPPVTVVTNNAVVPGSGEAVVVTPAVPVAPAITVEDVRAIIAEQVRAASGERKPAP
jgi:hypothetical protein